MVLRPLALSIALVGCGSIAPSPESSEETAASRLVATAPEVDSVAVETESSWPTPPPLDPSTLPCFAAGVAPGRYETPSEPAFFAVVLDGCVGVTYGGRAELPGGDGAFASMLMASLAGSQRVLSATGNGLSLRGESWTGDRSVPPTLGPAVALTRTGDVPPLELALFDRDGAVRAAAVAAAVGRQGEPRIAALLVRYLEVYAAVDDDAGTGPMWLAVTTASRPTLVRALPGLLPHEAHCREAAQRIAIAMPPADRVTVLTTFVEETLTATNPDACSGLHQVGMSLIPAGAAFCVGLSGGRCLSEADTERLFSALVDLALTRARTELQIREVLDLAQSLVYPVDPAFLRAAAERSSCDEQVRLLSHLRGASSNAPETAALSGVYAAPIRGGLCERASDEAVVLLAARAVSHATEETWQLIFEALSGPRGAALRDRIARAIEWPASPPSRCVHGLGDASPTGVRVAAAVGLGVCP